MKFIPYSFKILSLFLFFYLLSKTDWEICFNYIKKIHLIHLLTAILIIYLGYFLKCIRWNYILKSLDSYERITSLFKIFLIGGYLGIITPGKIGDFGRIYYLKNKIDWKNLTASLLIDRFNDFVMLVILSALGIIRLQSLIIDKLKLEINNKLIFGLTFFVIVFFFLVMKFKPQFKEFYLIIKKSFSIKNNLLQMVLTLLSMLIIYSSYIIVSKDLDISISSVDIFFTLIIVGILNLLPITVLGIGVREATIIYFFGLHGINYEIAIAFSLIIFAIQIITFLPGAYWFYKNPINFDKKSLS